MMANSRQELKQIEKAMEILRDLRKSAQIKESELLDKDLMLVYVKYSERYMDLVPMVKRKTVLKKPGGAA
jgi:hypothetical protein